MKNCMGCKHDLKIDHKYHEPYNVWIKNATEKISFSCYDAFYLIHNKLLKNKNFSFLRLCDGDIFIMKNQKSFNGGVNKSTSRLLSEKLKYLINRKIKYNEEQLVVGMQGKSKWDSALNIVEYSDLLRLVLHESPPSSFFNWCLVTGKMNEILCTINDSNRPIIYVGSNYCSGKLQLFKNLTVIKVPRNKCWNYQKMIDLNIEYVIDKFLNKNKQPIIIYCSSVSTKLSLINQFNKYNNKITQLDFGSALDPYFEISSRPWHPFAFLPVPRIKTVTSVTIYDVRNFYKNNNK